MVNLGKEAGVYQFGLTGSATSPGFEVNDAGFQTSADTVAPFKVLRPEEADPDGVRYGDHAGTYRLVVYHGKTTATDPGTGPDVVARLTNPRDVRGRVLFA